MKFLSERNLEMHKEYLNDLMLKYRIFEKSYPELSGADIDGICKSKIRKDEKDAAVKLFSEILAHKIYFSSFDGRNSPCERIKHEYVSVGSFLYDLKEKCNECKAGFLLIYEDRGRILYYCGADYEEILRYKKVILALDLCEHAYFYDYGFKKKDYIINAISYFDLCKIEKSCN